MKVWVVLANGQRRSEREGWTTLQGVYGSETAMVEASKEWQSGRGKREWKLPFGRGRHGEWYGALDVQGGAYRFDFEVAAVEVVG